MRVAEVKIIQNGTASLGVTPATNRLILEEADRIQKDNQAVAKMARDYRAAHGTLDPGVDTQVAQYYAANPLFTKEEIADPRLIAPPSFKTPQDFLLSTGLTPPHTFALFDNVARAWAKGLSSGFVNSVIYGLSASVCAVVLSALAAYGIVRLRIPWGLFWFLLIYSGTVFPFQMYLIPLFNLYLDTGMYDTRLGMIAFYIAITIPFCTFVMRGFFLTVPWQIQEAAALDGASSWQTFWRIMFPMARAPLILLVLITRGAHSGRCGALVAPLTRLRGDRPLSRLPGALPFWLRLARQF